MSQEACSLQYYFLVLWRILGVLPPSKAYVEQLKSGCSDPSESDILHTLRWSSRLRVPTYVNWIKVGRVPFLLYFPSSFTWLCRIENNFVA